MLLTLTQVAESRDPHARGVDWLGLVTFSGSLFLLVFALSRATKRAGARRSIVGFLVASAVLIVLFLIVELRQERPMLDLTLFRKPAFAGASIVAFAVSSSMFAMFLYLTLYIQDVLGYGPLQAGLRFLPITLLSFFVAPIAGRLSVRVPIRMLLGCGLILVGVGLLTMTRRRRELDWTVLVPGFILAGAGIGLINPPLASTAVGVVHHSRSGMASGINNTFRQVGIATGIAGLGAIFQHELPRDTTSALSRTAAGHEVLHHAGAKLSTALVSGEVGQLAHALPRPARAALSHAYRVGFTQAFSNILLIAACVALVGAAFAFALVRSRDFVTAEPAGASGPPASRRPRPSPPAEPHRTVEAARRSRGGRALRADPARSVAAQPTSVFVRSRSFPALVAVALDHRNARVSRISWVDSREGAQREDGAARVAHLLLMRACVAQPRPDAAARRSARLVGHRASLRAGAHAAASAIPPRTRLR